MRGSEKGFEPLVGSQQERVQADVTEAAVAKGDQVAGEVEGAAEIVGLDRRIDISVLGVRVHKDGRDRDFASGRCDDAVIHGDEQHAVNSVGLEGSPDVGFPLLVAVRVGE